MTPHHLNPTLTPHHVNPTCNPQRPALGRARRLLALAAIALTGAGLHALPATASASSSPEATLQVVGSSSSPQLLRGLTISQFAALARLTPEQLVARLAPSLTLGSATVELNALLANPVATVGDLIDLLAAAGVPTATISESLDRSLAAVTGNAEQLAETLNALLADLAGDGRLSTLAGELKLPAAVVEALNLAPASAEKVSESLNTTADHLGALLGAGGTTSSSAQEALVTAPLRSVLPGTSTLLGMPGGSGGVTLMTVNSTTSPTSTAAGASPGVGNAFSVVSVKVTRSGLIVETVRLPAPGRLAISASAARKVRVRSKHGHSRVRTRSAKVASAAGQQTAGTHTITLRPRGRLTKARRYTLTLITTFTPNGGKPASVRRSLVVKHPAKKSRARSR
jgi:hypothetical protein